MKMQQLAAKPLVSAEDLYVVSLAEAKYALGREVERLPVAGFRMPMVAGMSVSMIFPDRLPMDYDGLPIWPQTTATSQRVKGLASALGLSGAPRIELWCGQFNYHTQCFELTTPGMAEYLAAYIYDPDDTIEEGLSAAMLAYADKTHPLICQAITDDAGDGADGFLLIEQIGENRPELSKILAAQEQEYQDYLHEATAARKTSAAQRAHCRATMETLIAQFQDVLDWGWRSMTDFAVIYYVDGAGDPVEERFEYVQRDVDALRDLGCIAEEAAFGHGFGDPEPI